MQFLTPNATEVGELLNDDNMQYKDDIDIKIVDGSDVVGFIISTLTPVRFVGVKDFGCHGNAFDEYRLHLMKDTLKFQYENDIQTIPNIYTEEIIATRPYIETDTRFIVYQNTTVDITIIGGIYDPSVVLEFGDGITFNHYTLIEPNRIIANISIGSDLKAIYDIIMKKGNLYHYGNTPTIEIAPYVIGIGEAGTFITNFNNGGTGEKAWGDKWKLSIEGKIDSIDGFFKTSKRGTPSNGTGPSSPYDEYYMFTERSGDNSGSKQIAKAYTNNFKQLTQMEFRYHMYGKGHGVLIVESQDMDGLWTQRWIQKGQNPTSQNSPFIYVNLDTSTWLCKAIRFVFSESTNYDADTAIDNIILTSV